MTLACDGRGPLGCEGGAGRARARLRIWLWAWILTGAVVAGPAAAAGVVVLPPRASEHLQTVALGATEWSRVRFEGTDLRSGEGLVASESLAPDRLRVLPDASALREIGQRSAATRAWVVDLQGEAGRATWRLLLVDLVEGKLYAAARDEGPVSQLGQSLARATEELLANAGMSGPSVAPPHLPELERYGRVSRHLQGGRLSDAWRALVAKPTPTAAALRARIERMAQAPETTLGQRSRLAVARGQTERARLWMRKELASTEDPDLVLAAAEIAEELGDYERALSFYERAERLDPELGVSPAGRARVLMELGRREEALQELSRPGVSVDPVILEQLAEQPGLDERTRAQIHLRAAAEYQSRFDGDRAKGQLEQAEQLDEGLGGTVSNRLTRVHADLGELEQAMVSAERAVELHAADAEVWTALGRSRRSLGDNDGASAAFEQAHQLAPNSVAPVVELGELAKASGNKLDALKMLGEAIKMAPGASRARLAMAEVLRDEGDTQSALTLLQAHPGGPTAELLRMTASIQAGTGQLEAAEETLAQAIEMEPENGSLHSELARVHEIAGATGAAEEARRMANLLAPEGDDPRSAAREGAEARDDGQAGYSGSLAGLVSSFPTQLPGQPAPLRAVALLSASQVEPETWPDRLKQLLRPKRSDPEAFTATLQRALEARYDVVPPNEIPSDLAAEEQETLRAFAGDEGTVARMNEALGTDAVFVARIDPVHGDGQGAGGLKVALRMGVGMEADQVRRFRNEAVVGGGQALYSRWNRIAFAIYALVLVIGVLPLIRGWGELVVGIQYSNLGKGFFSIKLSRRPGRADVGQQSRQPAGRTRYGNKLSAMGRYSRTMVGKETLFKFIPARKYYVAVHGLLVDPVGEEAIGNYFAEQTVVVHRGQIARIDFDFRPKECPVEVAVFSGGEPVDQATVALRGESQNVRYARQGRTLLYLGPGQHRVLVGVGDRILEYPIRIEGLEPRTLAADANDEAATLFSGCPDAVEPFLQGNLGGAADALERAGHETAAARLRAEHYVELGRTEEAAACFEQAGCFAEAAALLSDRADPVTAASLHERAGNHKKAAEAYRDAGALTEAGRSYEAAYLYDDAIECYREAGDPEKVAELFEKQASYLEAARAALELGDTDRAIRDLQAIELRDSDHASGCRLLGRIFAERGELDLAIQKLDEALSVSGGDTAPLDLQEEFAQVLERAGRTQEALEVYEAIRARDFHYPNVVERIEALKQALTTDRAATTGARTVTRPAQSRYELLGEIGRGGMGVVFKARDRRLGRVVALKRLPDNLRNHPTAVRLFLREARAAAALNHRNIVTLYDADQEGDVYFITMEFLEGMSLHEVLAKRKRLSVRDVARLGSQISAGLEYAHGQGIVHRDIKTSNLFFTKDRVLKIMDFGLAKMTEEVRRAATVVGGTPYYMAPEQAAGEDVDHRADLYALGITLFELLTGDVPFRKGDVAHHHRHTPPPDPRTLVEVPESLSALILALLAKQPEQRPATTAEVTAHLSKIARSLTD